jgi:3-hydroxy-9,10-secoandrosta-1,3,5(10)-triene-9,17-dione monooxygenase reductase component
MTTSLNAATNPASTFDAKHFRQALSQFGTGVAIVTARDQAGAPIGMTINSFASVSLDPPLILWSVQLDSPSSAGFRSADTFAVTVLKADEGTLAARFAKSDMKKFDGMDVSEGWGRVPLVGAGVARFECTTEARHLMGDHEILIGRVMSFHSDPGPALGFHQGKFITLHA